ncbi:Hypothetical predicted protein [Cloeon dipterum]|uniref:C-type lectin domain-containing protein n=1 Tax=Cloeon dipterum TaxID=197152 RepID=A0A8S1CWZ4_9INSE|nr:Hypothetical predicted protein [Cloeon dipterum]
MQTKGLLLFSFFLLVIVQLCLADVDDDRQRGEIERNRRRRKEELRAQRRLQKEQRMEKIKKRRDHQSQNAHGLQQQYEAPPPVHNRHRDRTEQANLRAQRMERRRLRQENELKRSGNGRRRNMNRILKSHEPNRKNGTRHNYVCPPDFVKLGNSCYLLSKQILSWQDAHYYCRDMNSHLASLETAWEDSTLRNYLDRSELARLERWIGGRFNWEINRWIWGSSGKKMGYKGFSKRNPNEDMTWHCVFMDPVRHYRWTHKTCFEALHFVCEAPLHKEEPPKDKNEI